VCRREKEKRTGEGGGSAFIPKKFKVQGFQILAQRELGFLWLREVGSRGKLLDVDTRRTSTANEAVLFCSRSFLPECMISATL
jgi:hypothetical protein